MIWRRQGSAVGERTGASLNGDRDVVPSLDGPANDAWAQLWFAIQRHVWSTLAVVPVDAVRGSIAEVHALAKAGHVYRHGAVRLIDATRAEPRDIQSIIAGANEAAMVGMQVVIAVGSPLVRPSAIAIARAVDASILSVSLGTASLAASRAIIESIGREHFIGSFALSAKRPDAAARARSTR